MLRLNRDALHSLSTLPAFSFRLDPPRRSYQLQTFAKLAYDLPSDFLPLFIIQSVGRYAINPISISDQIPFQLLRTVFTQSQLIDATELLAPGHIRLRVGRIRFPFPPA